LPPTITTATTIATATTTTKTLPAIALLSYPAVGFFLAVALACFVLLPPAGGGLAGEPKDGAGAELRWRGSGGCRPPLCCGAIQALFFLWGGGNVFRPLPRPRKEQQAPRASPWCRATSPCRCNSSRASRGRRPRFRRSFVRTERRAVWNLG